MFIRLKQKEVSNFMNLLSNVCYHIILLIKDNRSDGRIPRTRIPAKDKAITKLMPVGTGGFFPGSGSVNMILTIRR